MLSNEQRRDEVRALIDIFQVRSSVIDDYMTKIPLLNLDPDGKLFEQYMILVQLLIMWRGLPPSSKCENAALIIEYNKNIDLPINNVINYNEKICIEEDKT